MTLHDAISVIEQSDKFKLLKKFNGLAPRFNKPGPETRKVCFLDTETTSLDTAECKVIDLAMRIVEFDAAGNFYCVGTAYQSFNDPGEPLSDEVKKVTGYSDEMLTGQAIDWNQVTTLVDECVLVVAYNAGFDRPILERFAPVFAQKHWGCAMVEVDWFTLFGTKGKLEWLAYKIGGLYFDAHQALADVDIMVQLLSLPAPDGRPVFHHLLSKARVKTTLLRAVGAPFEAKDNLKAAGFRWEDNGLRAKAWTKSFSADQVDEALAFLSSLGCKKPERIELSALDRYSTRA
ncbi:3'-5' exonuclease [Thiomicrospira microaerophila]|uniref:3'-5' exonuclease n=1 Tax=Thiomicrospira microaerophila TaxID=406020 RepID=UPI0005CAD344|nr:3'-5' exonuclease [Thiomicrospira microaerophila]